MTGLSLTNGNYQLTSGTVTVTAPPTPSGTQVYNATTNAPAAFTSATTLQGSDTFAGLGLPGTGTLASANAGPEPEALATASGLVTGLSLTNGNYQLTTGTVTVTPAPLTLTGTQVYNATTNALAASFTSATTLQGSDTFVGLGLSGTGTLASANAGPEALATASGLVTGLSITNGNYQLTSGTVTVTPASLTLTGTQVYNATTNALAASFTSATTLQGSDTFAGLGLSSTGTLPGQRGVGDARHSPGLVTGLDHE